MLNLSQADDKGLGETGEFTLAKRAGDTIEFLMQHRFGGGNTPEAVPWGSSRAEPMRRALSDQSGFMIGLDYRGAEVIAAYEPIPDTGWGMVAKLNMDEVRAPLLHTSFVVLALGTLLSVVVVVLFLKIGTPILVRLRESEARIQSAFNNPTVGMAIARIDGDITEANARFLNMLERDETGTQLSALQNQLAQFDRELTAAVRPQSTNITLRFMRGETQQATFHLTLLPIGTVNGVQTDHALILAEDVTKKVRAEEQVRHEQQMTRLILESVGEGIYGLDKWGRMTFVNATAARLLGYQNQELVGQDAHSLIHHTYPTGKPYPRHKCPTSEVIQSGEVRRVTDEVFWRKDGYSFPVEYVSTPIIQDRRIIGAVIAFRDITLRKQTELQLEYLAFHDPLTGLPNRQVLLDRITHLLKRESRGKGQPYALLFLDADRFKRINDSLGHLVGDEVLRQLADRYARCIRVGDTLARYGGDEFVMLLEDLDTQDDAYGVVKRIYAELARPCQINTETVTLSTSIGIVFGSEEYSCADQLVRDADIAVYESKKKGGGTDTLFSPQLRNLAAARLVRENQIRSAVKEERFEVYYQPIIDLCERRLLCMEALVRMRDEQGTLISPDDFLPLAEESSLIVDIGRLVLREACRQANAWRARSDCDSRFQITVNLSPRQLTQKGLLGTILEVLRTTNLPASALKLEVTESLAITDIRKAKRVLGELRELGIETCLDDFGTGYSSLAYLHKLPIDALKIDKNFVSAGVGDEEGWAIVRSIISLAKSLNIQVIAEGIEDEAAAHALVALGCSLGQGYLYSPPVPAGEATLLFEHLNELY